MILARRTQKMSRKQSVQVNDSYGFPPQKTGSPSKANTMSHQQNPTSNSTTTQKSLLKSLLSQKDSLTAKINENLQQLDNLGFGMDRALVDTDNFPLANVDHYAIRKMRGEVNQWRNDLKALVDKIENEMHELHRVAREEGQVNAGKSMGKDEGSTNLESDVSRKAKGSLSATSSGLKPFLYIGEIHDNSPAQEAGLRLGDQVTRFGPVTKKQVDQRGLACVAEAVQERLNEEMVVLVRRRGENEERELKFVPRVWSGRGYLGCSVTLV
mmetsp:Transcript_1090/g.3739  ORF Transcript_1090/g.3739 Transcript_1090/m.3739 type:complete len:269 (+) Transcript_1090:2514-3320(+)